MGRRQKDGKYVNVNIDRAAFEALEQHCRESGQTKTVAVERALIMCYGQRRGKAWEGGPHGYGKHAEAGS